jgi:hypothetical protein
MTDTALFLCPGVFVLTPYYELSSSSPITPAVAIHQLEKNSVATATQNQLSHDVTSIVWDVVVPSIYRGKLFI